MKRLMLVLVMVIFLMSGSLVVAACEIENWRWRVASDTLIIVEGATTCEKGKISIRFYNADGHFLGATSAYIRGYIFGRHFVTDERGSITIRYHIEER